MKLKKSYKLLAPITITITFLIDLTRCSHIVNVGRHVQVHGDIITFNSTPVSQFLGVPYAEPPLGKLRFQKPRPLQTVPHVLLAFNPPSACYQEESPAEYPWYDEHDGKSEDCLYLNIWAPLEANSENQKAVIYWIHGGGFRLGSNRQIVYYGAPLAALGDVVVVTVNYRLGPFGFLTSGTDEAPGNAGLWDILEGLKWVNQHISAFGGDPSKVTLAGQGAGSVAVGLLSVSPLAVGLFRRQIMQSGSPAYPDNGAPKRNLDLSQEMAERLKCANHTYKLQDHARDIVRCLRDVDADILNNVPTSLSSGTSGFKFVPTYGDDILPTDPKDAVSNTTMKCMQLLIGVTKDEGSTKLIKGFPTLFGDFGFNNPSISKSQGKDLILENFRFFPNPQAVADHYLPTSLPETSNRKIRSLVEDAAGDATEVCPTEFYAEKCSEGGGNVYFYVWQHRPSNSKWAPWTEVYHFSEVEFVFGKPLRDSDSFQENEAQLSREVIETWSSFAKNGKPNIQWPLYTQDNPQFKYLGPAPRSPRTGKGFHQDRCNFFRPYFGF